MNSYIAGFILPLIFLALSKHRRSRKRRGVPADVGGQPGLAVRNAGFESPVTSLWEGITTLAELFKRSCMDHSDRPFLGSRELISREVETDPNGRTFEKLHLSGYKWVTYSKAFEAVVCFASGLAELGHYRDERAAILADTGEEWFISLQGCFRRHVTVVTLYTSLGEEALTHSLNETEVTTVICGLKELRTLANVRGQLGMVKRVICMDENIPAEVSSALHGWTVISLAEVKTLGAKAMVAADLPLPRDVAVIMYTSGSTGVPKGLMMTHANIVGVLFAVMTKIPKIGKNDVYLAYLPMAHILELVAELLGVL